MPPNPATMMGIMIFIIYYAYKMMAVDGGHRKIKEENYV